MKPRIVLKEVARAPEMVEEKNQIINKSRHNSVDIKILLKDLLLQLVSTYIDVILRIVCFILGVS